jgi:uncharacterized protein (DUF2225 family)
MGNEDFILSANDNSEFTFGKNKEKDSALKVSFFSKEVLTCPVCETAFHKEELLSGSGRLIAGPLTEELHRLYEASSRYGDLYPLAYSAVVCPDCLFASMLEDFQNLPDDRRYDAENDTEKRKDEVEDIFPHVNFNEPRNLISGAISYYLVMRCYDYYPVTFSPTVKQGVAALRASWLLEHMNEKEPGQHWDWLAVLFKRKARFFYQKALYSETAGTETLSALKIFGPDLDKNYGYEGFLYICGLLEYNYGDRRDSEKRKETIAETKRTLAKMFGLGKTSKNKPGPMLEKARGLYDTIAKDLNEFDE